MTYKNNIIVWCAIVTAVALIVAVFFWLRQGRGNVRADVIGTLSRVAVALEAEDKETVLKGISIPTSMRDRSADEQYRFIAAALDGEVSEAGLRILAKEGAFGSLTEIFPDEGSRWAAIAGVDPAACVAFKLERDGFRAEVAVATNGIPKVIRLNNIRRLADKTP